MRINRSDIPILMARRAGWASAFLILLSLSLWACHKGSDGLVVLPEASAETTESRDFGRAVVESERLENSILATGTVEPSRTVTLSAPYLARIEEVDVREGDEVEPDDELVSLDTTNFRQQRAQAQANVASARVQMEQAAAEIERHVPLVDRGIVAEQQLDQLRAQRDALEESVEAAEAVARLTRSQMADGIIRAPFLGTVTEVQAEVGAMATAGGSLVRLVDMSAVDVRTTLAEDEISVARVGAQVNVRIPALDLERAGAIRFVDPELDPTTRTGEILVRVDNSDRQIFAGSFAEVVLTRPASRERLSVPADAVLRTANGDFVVVMGAEGFERRTVAVERLADGRWEILDGATAGEQVVTGDLGAIREDDYSAMVGGNAADTTLED
ncbi:MAG: efflux RND transporter periplasmic adaptor subunit [Myxococcales bacterium]|nr:efflux RND transporter periplasmic adaptor subunit [Myxococcales bacterium]